MDDQILNYKKEKKIYGFKKKKSVKILANNEALSLGTLRDSNAYPNNQISGGVKEVWEHLR